MIRTTDADNAPLGPMDQGKPVPPSGPTLATSISSAVVGLVGLTINGIFAQNPGLPLPWNPSNSGLRFLVSVLLMCLGVGVCAGALTFAKWASRSIPEIAFFVILLFNALVAVSAWMTSGYLVVLLSGVGFTAPNDGLRQFAIMLIAFALFLVDVLAFCLLLPLARASGSSLFQD